MMIENKFSDQYLTTCKVSTRSILKLRRYRLVKTLTRNFNLNHKENFKVHDLDLKVAEVGHDG